MKRILLSAGMIVFVSAAYLGATGAFFNDTEASTGNTFSAGSIDLKVDSTSHYAGLICDGTTHLWKIENQVTTRPDLVGLPCGGTWALKDLDPTSDKFFNFSDVKPGDPGEDTISLHIDNNPAWACVDIKNVVNNDNTCTTPEASSTPADPECANKAGQTLNNNLGELGQNMQFVVWIDNGGTAGTSSPEAGNNKLDTGEQVITVGAPPSTDTTYALADSTTGGGPITPDGTSYLGVAWCVGTFANAPGVGSFGSGPWVPNCDGSGVGNDAQTDSYTADIDFRVEQSRNNPNFRCTPPVETDRPTVGALLSAYTAPTGGACNITVNPAVAEDSTHSHTITGGVGLASTGQTVCVVAGTYDEDVNVNKDITLAGAGSATTNIVGQTSGEPGALVITADGATVEGFNVTEATGGVAAVRISGAHSGITVNSNTINGAAGGNAFLTDGGQSNHTISNNVINGGGSAAPIAYVNGQASVQATSTNIDFLNNTFGGSGSEALGEEASGSQIQQNKFSATTGFTDVEDWSFGNLINQNNFNDAVNADVLHSQNVNTGVTGTTNAENNWWGDNNPADGDAGPNVDFTPFESSAFPQN